MNIHKAMIIPNVIFQTNKKFFVMVHPKNECRLEMDDHLWPIFLDHPQSDVVVFAIITLRYIIFW